VVLVNGHGGNYVLNNVAQEANVDGPSVVVYPTGRDWDVARRAAGLETTAHDDMHGGEAETSILLHYAPDSIAAEWESADHQADERPDLLLLGMMDYTRTGIIGRPSLATASKGEALVHELVQGLAPRVVLLREGSGTPKAAARPRRLASRRGRATESHARAQRQSGRFLQRWR
jgi:creatinine amidohydrolase